MGSELDLNLLVVLDALLEEGSVTDAAARLDRSMAAISRALARIRVAFDDPILVRSGRRLVPTPRALEIQARVHELIEAATNLATEKQEVDIRNVSRIFVIATSDPLMCSLGTPLVHFLEEHAPGIKTSFVVEGPVDVSLRTSVIDMEVGIIRHHQAEAHVECIFEDRLVGIARNNHPIFAGPVTLDSYTAQKHLLHARTGTFSTGVDDQLARLGRSREIGASAATLAASLFMLTHTDLVGTCLEAVTRPIADELGLRYFELPIERRRTPISLTWHPRYDRDPVHAWLRGELKRLVGELAKPLAAPSPKRTHTRRASVPAARS